MSFWFENGGWFFFYYCDAVHKDITCKYYKFIQKIKPIELARYAKVQRKDLQGSGEDKSSKIHEQECAKQSFQCFPFTLRVGR